MSYVFRESYKFKLHRSTKVTANLVTPEKKRVSFQIGIMQQNSSRELINSANLRSNAHRRQDVKRQA